MELACCAGSAFLLVTGTVAASAEPSITVCKDRDMRGRCVTLRHGVNDLRFTNSVRNMNGTRPCVTVDGDVNNLADWRMNDSISSVHRISREGKAGPRERKARDLSRAFLAFRPSEGTL